MSFLGDNIKVHFAGSDGEEIFHAALKCADIKYRLYSCFSFIDKKEPQDDFRLPDNHIIKVQDREMKHVIQDSGLFTLMFGAGKNRKVDHDYLLKWQDKLIQFVLQNNLRCSVVEIDCQKLLGVDEAWYFRKRMKALLPNRQINVFHYEDGKEGLDRLIEFSDYIAFSVPELRIVKPKTYKKDAVNLARYAKKMKPSIDIHMLGCTEYAILPDISFCTTADSTSWLSGVKYGYFNDGRKKGHINTFKKEIVEKREADCLNALQERNILLASKTLRYTTSASLCASIAKQRYAELAGSQD